MKMLNKDKIIIRNHAGKENGGTGDNPTLTGP